MMMMRAHKTDTLRAVERGRRRSREMRARTVTHDVTIVVRIYDDVLL